MGCETWFQFIYFCDDKKIKKENSTLNNFLIFLFLVLTSLICWFSYALYIFYFSYIKVGLQIDAPTPSTSPMPTIDKGQETTGLPNLPKPLTLEEKKFLLAVERGDLANVRR